MIVVHGIPNCDTVRKARKWLDAHGIEYRFHDFRKDGLDPATLRKWVEAVGWETLLNRRGQTWRKLDPAVREAMDERLALEWMQKEPTLIRRPVVETPRGIHVGFHPDEWEDLFA